ncbi:hypothetical protein MBLNU457_g0801t1 [Dothideomycetes sp. NU457]
MPLPESFLKDNNADERAHSRSQISPPDVGLGSVFVLEDSKKKDKEEQQKIKSIQARLARYGITAITTENVEYALRQPSVNGNAEEAVKLLLLLEDTYEGVLKAYNPNTKLLGAVNRKGVTCYLDALLFAMFARLDSFEAMLYNSLEDPARKKLAGILRLWVNLLRTGRLIPTDVTKQVQESLADCGWAAANQLQQQDTSEAFTFVTGQLELPLLTLKMDMFHTGKEDPNDDHKFINERLLEVAIIPETAEGGTIKLEECLEQYFNNRVEVKRHLENQRRTSLNRMGSVHTVIDSEKASSSHVECLELTDPDTPTSSTPVTSHAFPPESPRKGLVEQLRPVAGIRNRSDSIFSSRRKLQVIDGEPAKPDDNASVTTDRPRQASIRTEVLMPAWQFFKLLPWYTENAPTSDAQVAAHFARKRPVLGICLKRYTVSNTGVAERLDQYIDIPLEIAVPDFVGSDDMQEGSPLVGNFKLVLQSVVCHRGKSVHSGHYVSLVRGYAANAAGSVGGNELERPDSSSSDEVEDPWMLFDDLATERVTYVDINKALKDECPYLLFYQVQPIDPDDAEVAGPPSYHEATSRAGSDVHDEVPEKIMLPEYSTEDAISPTSPNGLDTRISFPTDAVDWAPSVPPSGRTSMDAGNMLSTDYHPRQSTSSNRPSRRSSDEDKDSFKTQSGVTTPFDESRSSFLGAFGSRRNSKVSSSAAKKARSRPQSQGPSDSGNSNSNNRFSLNMAKLTARMSRNDTSSTVPQSPSLEFKEPILETPLTISTSDGGSLPSIPSAPGSVVSEKEVPKDEKDKDKKKEKGKGTHGLRRKKKAEDLDRGCNPS